MRQQAKAAEGRKAKTGESGIDRRCEGLHRAGILRGDRQKGDDMAFLDLVSKEGKLKVTVFPRDFEQMREDAENIKEGVAVKINGKFKESEEFGDAFIAKSILICEPSK